MPRSKPAHDQPDRFAQRTTAPPTRALQGALIAACLLLALSLAGCSVTASWLAPAATATPEPTATATATATATPTLTPTATPTSTPTPTPSPTPIPLQVSMSLEPLAVRQGHTSRLLVHTNLPASVVGSHVDRTFSFVSEDGLSHRAVLGISALAELVRQPVVVTIQTQDGREVALNVSIEVLSGEYEEEYISLSPQTAQLLDPEIARPELEVVEEIFATYSPHILWDDAFQWPLDPRITSHFGTRRSYGGQVTGYHAGLDLGALAGTEVRAPAPGVVIAAEELQVRGNAVFVDHGAGVVSGYFHLSEMLVESGQTLETGDLLGLVGSTGLSTGAHLHWEIRVLGIPVDPVEWLEITGTW
ncbi:MAG: M23 family metallopeptidase [Anaerolineae bacterium]